MPRLLGVEIPGDKRIEHFEGRAFIRRPAEHIPAQRKGSDAQWRVPWLFHLKGHQMLSSLSRPAIEGLLLISPAES